MRRLHADILLLFPSQQDVAMGTRPEAAYFVFLHFMKFQKLSTKSNQFYVSYNTSHPFGGAGPAYDITSSPTVLGPDPKSIFIPSFVE